MSHICIGDVNIQRTACVASLCSILQHSIYTDNRTEGTQKKFIYVCRQVNWRSCVDQKSEESKINRCYVLNRFFHCVRDRSVVCE